jgi:hypothetical protein
MRRFLLALTIIMVMIMVGCESKYLRDSDKELLLTQIEKYTSYNEITDVLHDEKLEDVEVDDFYLKEDFFNYDNKGIENVELEYSTHYNAFSSLEYILNYIKTIDEFNYGNYYELEDYNAMIKVTSVDRIITIDYYQYFDELDIASRQYYVLKEKDSKLSLERYSTTVDLKTNDILLHQKLSVLEGDSIEQVEYIPKTMSYTYIYNSFEEQEYFKCKAFFDEYGDYNRETVEMYLEEHNSFVSYDIKNNELEDYRIKVFHEGHRVLKYDVNIFNKKETETEFTWNLLSVDGWTQVSHNSGEYQVFNEVGRTMEDYHISIQRNGYGKVNAYKLVTGDVSNREISLNNYNLESNISLDDLEAARQSFEDVYIQEVENHGFLVSNNVNMQFIENYFISYLENGKLNDFMNIYK